jgi:hypothetical protein
MSDTHCDQCGGPFSSAHSDPNLRIQLAAKDAEIAALTELVQTWERAANLWMGKALDRAQAIAAASAALEMSGGVL